jgi:hypothetical protein
MNRAAERAFAFAAFLAAIALVLAAPEGRASAQQNEPDGRITGAVIAGTEGASTDGVSVRLIILEASEVTGSEETPVVDGQFEFAVPARASRTYVPFVRHQGIQYFGDPVILAPEEPEATREITIYETTSETPELTIVETVVTVLGLDRQRGQIALEREDIVRAGGDRVFIGDDAGVTLRIPAPADTLDAGGVDPEGTTVFDGGVVSSTVPLRPDAPNSVVTRYLVQYDPADDRYLLRVTAPLRVEHMEVRVPQGYVHRITPREGAERGEDVTLEGNSEGQVLHTVVLAGGAEPGHGLLVELVGLSGRQESLVLTEQRGALAAAGLALAIIAGAAVAVLRRRGADA